MLRAIRLFSLLLLGTGSILYSRQAVAQALNPTGLAEWDSTNQVLFFVNGGSPIRAYTDYNQRGADIDVLKDFPRAQEFYVNSLTAGPGGTTLIAATLIFGDYDVRELVLTYDSSGHLLKTWNPAPQYMDQIAYSKDDDALFVLGSSDVPNTPDYPLLVEYDRDGRVLKNMIPASTLKKGGDSFNQNGEIGQPMLKITKNYIYFYAPTNREVVMCDRDGAIITHRSINDIVDKVSTEDGYHLVQTHHVDFAENGDLVAELLLWNDANNTSVMEVVRLSMSTGEAVSVHKASNSGRLWFVGMKDDQYLYLAGCTDLYIQSSAAQEPVPLNTKQID